MQPLRDKILCSVLPQTQRSSLLTTPERQTPIRKVVCDAVGPDAILKGVCIGQVYLANILSAQEVGEQLLLPYKALVAEWEE